MKANRSPVSLIFLLCVALVLGCVLAGCWPLEDQPPAREATQAASPTGTSVQSDTPTQPSIPSTPTANIERARAALESGGELTYHEIKGLRPNAWGFPREDQFPSSDEYNKLKEAYRDDFDFARQLEKCRLAETIGWIAWWEPNWDSHDNEVPNLKRVLIYLYDPYSGPMKDYFALPEMYMVGLTDEQVALMKYGQRVRFSGDLLLIDRQVSVKNAKYELLDDEITFPTPTAEEMQDLQIRLSRSICYGLCPDYDLTITADGQVTFEGGRETRVKGTVTTKLDEAQLLELVREFRKADFYSLNDEYPEAQHAPEYVLSLRLGGKTKTVTDHANAPRRLGILQNRIDQIVKAEQWIK